MAQPARGLHHAPPFLLRANFNDVLQKPNEYANQREEKTHPQRIVAAAHYMDVCNVQETQLCALVDFSGLSTLTLHTMSNYECMSDIIGCYGNERTMSLFPPAASVLRASKM